LTKGNCKLKIANWKLQIEGDGRTRSFNLQFAICNLQFAILPFILSAVSPIAHADTPTTQPAITFSRIDHPAIRESSGIVASRKHPGVFWTHNDSGNGPSIYAITREGKFLAEYTVRATNIDWEDIAIDDAGHLYIGEIGNNARRKQIAVHQIDEPDVGLTPAPATLPATLPATEPIKLTGSWQLRFPGGNPFDSESLFIHDGNGYVISKRLDGGEAKLYRFSLKPQSAPKVLEEVTTLPIRAPVTAADLSADARQLVVCTPIGLHLFDLPKDGGLTALGKATPRVAWYLNPVMEGACFAPGGVFTTCETRQVIFFPVETFTRQDGSDGSVTVTVTATATATVAATQQAK